MPATRAAAQPSPPSDPAPETKRQKRDTSPAEAQPPKRTSSRILDKESAKAKDAPAPKPARVTRKPSQATAALIKDIDALKLGGSSAETKQKQKATKVLEPKPIVIFNPLPAPLDHRRPPLHLFVWGAGDAGQLAMGPDFFDQLNKPRRSSFVDQGIEDGIFGGNEDAGLETIAAGGLQTLFIDESGTVWSCGANDNAALGRQTHFIPDPKDDKQSIEVDVDTSLPVSVPSPIKSLVDEGFRAVRIYAGDSISAAISDQGELRIWGTFRGNQGLVGFSTEAEHEVKPTAVFDTKTEKVTSVAIGNNHLILLTTAGNVYTLGVGEEGQLGRRVVERRKIRGTLPEKIVLGNKRHRKAVIVGAGNNHSFAVDEDGVVWGWGINSKGQLGTGMGDLRVDGEVMSPKKVIGLSKAELGDDVSVVEIAGGDHHTLFLTSDGRVFACGLSEEGRLGLDDDNEVFQDRKFPDFIPEPVHVPFPSSHQDDPVIHIASGTNNNLAVTRDGALYAWGRQVVGELGLGHDEDVKTPTVVVKRKGNSWAAEQVACGGQHVLALLRKRST